MDILLHLSAKKEGMINAESAVFSIINKTEDNNNFI